MVLTLTLFFFCQKFPQGDYTEKKMDLGRRKEGEVECEDQTDAETETDPLLKLKHSEREIEKYNTNPYYWIILLLVAIVIFFLFFLEHFQTNV